MRTTAWIHEDFAVYRIEKAAPTPARRTPRSTTDEGAGTRVKTSTPAITGPPIRRRPIERRGFKWPTPIPAMEPPTV